MSTTAVAHVYDRLDAALLAHSNEPQARWIRSQMIEHPEDELLISVTTASATVFLGATGLEDAARALAEARGELGVQHYEVRGREDVAQSLKALLEVA